MMPDLHYPPVHVSLSAIRSDPPSACVGGREKIVSVEKCVSRRVESSRVDSTRLTLAHELRARKKRIESHSAESESNAIVTSACDEHFGTSS
eukprot:scaffold37281_cov44-Attheya_sp.AAC.4